MHCVNDRLLCPSGGGRDETEEEFCQLVAPYRSPAGDDGDGEKLTRYQRMLLHVLRHCWRSGYRKLGDAVYERVTHRGRPIGAWRRVCTLEQLVYAACRRTERFDQWLNLTAGAGNAAAAALHLQNQEDHELPTLSTSRHLFAFLNGVYITRADAFHPHDAIPPEYADTASAKFFEADLDPQWLAARGWRDIPTPSFQSILAHQRLDRDGVGDWMYIMLGRLLYEVGELDNWQVVPFLMGMAATGKSTILLSVCRHLFAEEDVGVLSNNIEKKFGLWGFVGKKLFIAPEVKADLHLDQAEFQSLVSGDAIQVAQKHQQSRTVQWRVPGILAGNEVPGWRDSAGSITRRILLFHFEEEVQRDRVDTRLGEKMVAEVPRLLVKCNRAYLEAVRSVGAVSIWDAVPQYFRTKRDLLQACVDTLWEFLNSGTLVFGPHDTTRMPFTEFQSRYKDWCRDNSLPLPNLGAKNADAIARTLGSKGCKKQGSMLLGADAAPPPL